MASSYFDMNSYNNGGATHLPNNMQLALLTTGNVRETVNSGKENIRVAVRVRPLLPNEAHREEVVYYPTFEDGPLQVRSSRDNIRF
jgi:hypothetical protein